MDFRQRLEQSRTQSADRNSDIDSQDELMTTYFAMGRGYTPICLELRLGDGSHRAYPYSLFSEINFDADLGIEIFCAQKKIVITGRNMLELYDRILTYRVRYIQADLGSDLHDDDGTYVGRIMIETLSR